MSSNDNSSNFTENIFSTIHREYLAVYPTILQDLTNKFNGTNQNLSVKRFEKMFNHNTLLYTRHYIGYSVPFAYRSLCEPLNFNANDLNLANYLGWCVELLQFQILMTTNDILDDSETRNAISDGLVLDKAAYYILKKYFHDKPYYADLLDVLNEVTLIQLIGQALVMQSQKTNVLQFTREMCLNQDVAKGAFFLHYVTTALALHMLGINDLELNEKIKAIALRIDHITQFRNDNNDIYDGMHADGTIGHDIQNNKCTWLIVFCLERASEEQKRIIAENYGQNDVLKSNKIKRLFDEMDMQNAQSLYEEECVRSIIADIKELPTNNLREYFYSLLEK